MFETVLDKTIPSKPIVIPPVTADDVRERYAKLGLVELELDELPNGYTFYGPSPELIDRMAVQLMWQSKFGNAAMARGDDRDVDVLMREWINTNPSFVVEGRRLHLWSDDTVINAFVDSDNMLYEWRWAFIGCIFEKHGQLVYADCQPSDGILSSLDIVYATSGKRLKLSTSIHASFIDCAASLARAIWNEFGIPVV